MFLEPTLKLEGGVDKRRYLVLKGFWVGLATIFTNIIYGDEGDDSEPISQPFVR